MGHTTGRLSAEEMSRMARLREVEGVIIDPDGRTYPSRQPPRQPVEDAELVPDVLNPPDAS